MVGAKIIQFDHPLARLKAISGLRWFYQVFGNESFEISCWIRQINGMSKALLQTRCEDCRHLYARGHFIANRRCPSPGCDILLTRSKACS